MAHLSCPYCHFGFKVLASNSPLEPGEIYPILCERCAIVSLLEGTLVRKLTQPELDALKQSPSWEFISKAVEIIKNAPAL